MIFFYIYEIFSFKCSDSLPSTMLCKPLDCKLDSNITINCTVFPSVDCEGERHFYKNITCRYCYQLNKDLIDCEKNLNCKPSINIFTTLCYPKIYCMGNSKFYKKSICEKNSKSQIVAFFLSAFFGGIAADRFYLGYYFFGTIKLFSLGGFGIAYFLDLILITFGYLGPTNGDLYQERIY